MCDFKHPLILCLLCVTPKSFQNLLLPRILTSLLKPLVCVIWLVRNQQLQPLHVITGFVVSMFVGIMWCSLFEYHSISKPNWDSLFLNLLYCIISNWITTSPYKSCPCQVYRGQEQLSAAMRIRCDVIGRHSFRLYLATNHRLEFTEFLQNWTSYGAHSVEEEWM